MTFTEWLTALFIGIRCDHEFEKEIISSHRTSSGFGDVVVITCLKCGKIKKKKV